MKKRILSFLTALTMLVLAVPVFALTALAAAALPKSAFLDNRPTSIDANIGTGAVGESESIAYRGGWDYITYATLDLSDAAPLTTRVTIGNYKEEWYVRDGVTALGTSSAGFVNANESAEAGAWPGYGMGVYKDTVIGTRYTLPKSGIIDIAVDRLLNLDIKADSRLTLGYAVYVGGKKVWPTDGDWYEITYYGANVTERDASRVGEIGTDMAGTLGALPTEIAVSAGETVEFLVAGIDHYNPVNAPANPAYWNQNIARANYFDGRVTYTALEAPPEVLAAPSIGDTLDLSFSLASEKAGAGILINGKEATSLTVAPQDADRPITVQAYLKNGNETVYGEENTVTFNGILEKYLENAAYGEKAAAALAYTRAFAAYFSGGTVAAPTPPGGNYGYKAADSYWRVAACADGASVSFRGVSLLLNDRVNIKLVADTPSSRYALEVATDAYFSDAVTVGNRSLTEDGGGTKFIMDGISALLWDTDYYFRIVDTEDGNRVVSDTLRYGVSVYCARMNADPKAPANIKNLGSTMLALFEKLNDGAMTDIGDRIPLGAPVLVRTAYGTLPDAGSVTIRESVDYHGAVLRADAGFRFENATDITVSNVTLVGPVSFVGCTGVTLKNVQILADGMTAVTADAASRELFFADCRIEGAHAVNTAANGTRLLRSYIGYTLSGITATAEDALYIGDCRIVGGTGSAVASVTDNTEIRRATVIAGRDAAVTLGECRNVLVAASVIRGGEKSVSLTGTDNASLTLNSLGTVMSANGRHIYLVDNTLGGRLTLSDNDHLLADGNRFPSGAELDMIGNTNTNGDTVTDVNARPAAGANEDLLPHVDRDWFLGEERKEQVYDPDGSMELGQYIMAHAATDGIIILAPGAYKTTSAIDLGREHSGTRIYAYGVFSERAAEAPAGVSKYEPFDNHFDLDYAENITVKGGTYGYEAAGHAQAYVIEKLDGNRIRLKAAAGFLPDVGLSNTALFNRTTYGYRAGEPYFYLDTHHSAATLEANGTVVMTLGAADYNRVLVGDVITTRPSHGTAPVSTDYSKNIVYQDMTVFATMASVCFHEYYNQNAVTYFRVADTYRSGAVISQEDYNAYKALEAEYGIATEVWYDDVHDCYRGPAFRNSSCDGVHVVASKGGAKILSSLFERLADDGTNQFAYAVRLSSFRDNGDGTMDIIIKGMLSTYNYINGTLPSSRSAHMTHKPPVEAGDPIMIYTASGALALDAIALTDEAPGPKLRNDADLVADGGNAYLDTLRVKVKIASYHAEELESYLAYLDAYTDDDSAILDSHYNSYHEEYRVYFHVGGYAAAGARVENTKVDCCRSRAALLRSPDSVIKNCTYRHVGGPAVGVIFEPFYAAESAVVRNMMIENNLIDHVHYNFAQRKERGAITIDAPGDRDIAKAALFHTVTVSGNVFNNRASDYAVYFEGIAGIVIENNDFCGSSDIGGLPAYTTALSIDNATDVRIAGNVYRDPSNIQNAIVLNNIRGLCGADVDDSALFPAFS